MVRRRRRRFGWLAIIGIAGIAIAAYVLTRAPQRAKSPPLPQDCPLGATTAGIDVSYYQRDINWSQVRRAGIQYAFIRLSDGTDVFDEKFEANWSGAKRAKIL